MKFDYTFWEVGRFLLFEPLIIVSNLILFVIAMRIFLRARRSLSEYVRSMGWFAFFLGASGIFGMTVHSIHYQLGHAFLNTMNFCAFAMNLSAAYFCFRGSFMLHNGPGTQTKRVFTAAAIWLVITLIVTWLLNEFFLITIHAGLILVYSLWAHVRAISRPGSRFVVAGILISFLSIIVHVLHLSAHTWFNHKDLAHVFMILALVMIGVGVGKEGVDRKGSKEEVN